MYYSTIDCYIQRGVQSSPAFSENSFGSGWWSLVGNTPSVEHGEASYKLPLALLEAPKRRSIPSYMPNMMAALGTVRIRCGVRPPYRPMKPSSIQTTRKHCQRPVYLSCPLAKGACRSLVRAT